MGLKPGNEQYFNKSYDSKGRFVSYWHQINEVISLNPKNILEIGTGNKFFFNYLKDRGFDIISIDIDKKLNPKVVGNILDLPFKKSVFDVVTCFEVLEHLEFSIVPKAFGELARVSKKHIVISIPDTERAYRFNIQIPKIKEIKRLITIKRIRKPRINNEDEHRWEIGIQGYPLKRIINVMKKTFLYIENTYRVFEMPWHRFFILRKANEA
ncbi:MAG: class I SAM-dependent methyltransferase [Proteobacteria bacterium]|nr:class I SAM-dependent methyltransferase [Pseudomonadota bacterium]